MACSDPELCFFLNFMNEWHLTGLLGRVISPSQRPLPAQDNTTETQRQTSMPVAVFEPTIPVSKRRAAAGTVSVTTMQRVAYISRTQLTRSSARHGPLWAPEPVWTQRLEEELSVCAGDRTWSPGRPARSQTLYCLSYPAPLLIYGPM
jgi:hypothetical protein